MPHGPPKINIPGQDSAGNAPPDGGDRREDRVDEAGAARAAAVARQALRKGGKKECELSASKRRPGSMFVPKCQTMHSPDPLKRTRSRLRSREAPIEAPAAM